MRTLCTTTAAIAFAACLALTTGPVQAEDCGLDTDDNDTIDSTAGAESNGENTSLACGRNATTEGSSAVAVGADAHALTGGTVVGFNAKTTGVDAVAERAPAPHT